MSNKKKKKKKKLALTGVASNFCSRCFPFIRTGGSESSSHCPVHLVKAKAGCPITLNAVLNQRSPSVKATLQKSTVSSSKDTWGSGQSPGRWPGGEGTAPLPVSGSLEEPRGSAGCSDGQNG